MTERSLPGSKTAEHSNTEHIDLLLDLVLNWQCWHSKKKKLKFSLTGATKCGRESCVENKTQARLSLCNLSYSCQIFSFCFMIYNITNCEADVTTTKFDVKWLSRFPLSPLVLERPCLPVTQHFSLPQDLQKPAWTYALQQESSGQAASAHMGSQYSDETVLLQPPQCTGREAFPGLLDLENFLLYLIFVIKFLCAIA